MAETRPTLGGLDINLPVLLETRGLIQANSGGGKSHALRRLIEQTAPDVQQIIIDPEGEFASLREKFDFIICAPTGADAVATPATAAALARAVWESGSSAIVDIYELKAHERVLFVRRFLEALINAPKSIWHQTMVVLDEIQIFAPQTRQAESLAAVIDLATRGRKRGLALIGATQRLANLNKDVAAELLNKLIGRTGLDVDVKRAADELGMSTREAMEQLRPLDPGNFFAFGPALSRTIVKTRIGAVATTHPQPGQRIAIAPPPASKALLAKLSKLQGIQRAAVEEAKTVETLTAEVTKLRRELTIAQKAQPAPVKVGHTDAQVQALIAAERATSQKELAKLTVPLAKIRDMALAALGDGFVAMTREAPAAGTKSNGAITSHVPGKPPRFGKSDDFGVVAIDAKPKVDGLRSGAIRILQQLAARAPAGYSRPQVGALTQFSHKGGTFGTYLSDLRRLGFVEERGGLIYATDTGIHALGADIPETPTSHAEAMQLWRKALRSGAFSMLEAIVAAGPHGIGRTEVAESVGMQASGGTFGTYLSDLRRNSLISERDKRCVANDILFPNAR